MGEKTDKKAVVEVKTPGNLNFAVKTTGLKNPKEN